MAAARAWIDGTLFERQEMAVDDGLRAEAELLGIPQAAAAAMIERDEAARASRVETFTGVWPQHGEAVRAFVAAASQWRMAGSFFAGIDYAAAAIAWAALGIDARGETFSRFQAIECEVRHLLNDGARR
jgi:hypothetical protein